MSTMQFLLTQRYLRAGDGLAKTPESRLKERIFGEGGSGRTTLRHSGIKLELVGKDLIPPREDTCLAAYIREMCLEATHELSLHTL